MLSKAGLAGFVAIPNAHARLHFPSFNRWANWSPHIKSHRMEIPENLISDHGSSNRSYSLALDLIDYRATPQRFRFRVGDQSGLTPITILITCSRVEGSRFMASALVWCASPDYLYSDCAGGNPGSGFLRESDRPHKVLVLCQLQYPLQSTHLERDICCDWSHTLGWDLRSKSLGSVKSCFLQEQK